MNCSAREAAEKITELFKKHWAAFRSDLKEDSTLQSCRDKGMAWTMATNEISQFVFKQAKRDG